MIEDGSDSDKVREGGFDVVRKYYVCSSCVDNAELDLNNYMTEDGVKAYYVRRKVWGVRGKE